MIRLLKQEEDGSFQFHEFRDVNDNIPAYAILSHRWSEDASQEVVFKDFEAGTAADKAGYVKLEFCAFRASEDALQYFWIDSACINKSDAVEHSEAIRSMYLFYQMAARCYVYLSDVPSSVSDPVWKQEFKASSWFTRGWTLQELIAPRHVQFYSHDHDQDGSKWKWLGSKKSLARLIHEATRIPMPALRGNDISRYSLDKRLEWADGRETTREEDKAYCLLSFLDIHMEILYGEGEERAWRRLQEKIDQTRSQDYLDDGTMKKEQHDEDPFSDSHAVTPQSPDQPGTSDSPTSLLHHIRSYLPYALLALIIATSIAYWRESAADRTSLVITTANQNQLDRSLPIFAVIGRTGVGKSTFIDTLGGREDVSGEAPQVCHGLGSCTGNMTFHKFSLKMDNEEAKAYIIDTPGFDDEVHSDMDIMASLFNTLNALSFEDRLIKGLIYLYDISQTRIGGLTSEHLDLFEIVCGRNNFKSVALVTTKWLANPTSPESVRELQREQELKDKWWKKMLDVGSHMWRYDGSKKNAQIIIASLLHKPNIKLNLEQGWFQKRLREAENAKAISHEVKVQVTPENPSHQQPANRPRTISLGWKLTWTLFRILFVGFAVFVVGVEFHERYEGKEVNPVPLSVLVLFSIFTLALFIGLLWHSVIVSWSFVFTIFATTFVISLPIPPKTPPLVVLTVLMLALLSGSSMFWHWPLDRSTYFI